MDERVKKAIEFSNYRVSLFNIKENIKLRVDSMLTHAVNGGVFKSTPELITFVKLLIDSEKTTVVLIDSNGNPIEINNLEDFYDDLVDKYFQATNYYHVEYTALKKARSVKAQFDEIFSEDKN